MQGRKLVGLAMILGVLAIGVIGLIFIGVIALYGVYNQFEGYGFFETAKEHDMAGAEPNSDSNVPLAVVFAGWYGHDHKDGSCRGGLGSTHWSDSPDTGGVVHVPEKGYYCSSDPEIVGWQLEKMEEAGIRVVLYSWWGWGDGDLDGNVKGHPDQYINEALDEMFRQIRDRNLDMKVAVVVEPFPVTQGATPVSMLKESQGEMVLDYVWERFYQRYPGQVFRWQGDPLLLTFDPMTLPEDDRYTIRRWTGRARDRATESEGWDWFFAPQQELGEAISDDGVAFVYPRFDESYLAAAGASYITWEPRRIDPELTEGVYESQWRQLERLKDVAMVVLYSWNLYGEQAHVEPSSGGPAPVDDEYVTRTRNY